MIKKTAVKNGIDWEGHVARMSAVSEVGYGSNEGGVSIELFFCSVPTLCLQLDAIKSEIEKKDMVYPDYYLKQFHVRPCMWILVF